jgi:hypothetical protein
VRTLADGHEDSKIIVAAGRTPIIVAAPEAVEWGSELGDYPGPLLKLHPKPIPRLTR